MNQPAPSRPIVDDVRGRSITRSERLLFGLAVAIGAASLVLIAMIFRPVVVLGKPTEATFGHDVYFRLLGESSTNAEVAARAGLWLFIDKDGVHLLVQNEGGTWDRVRGYWPPWPAVEEIQAKVYDDARNAWDAP